MSLCWFQVVQHSLSSMVVARYVLAYCKGCPQCATVSGGGRQHRPPLKPIPIKRPFQKIGVDVMDLPCTERGNKHVVFQDMFTKWPLVFAAPDQRAERIARLLCEEVVPMFGVPEALLSDRGTNLLSHLMTDICHLLGIEKLNTTAYHPECDGMVERFNRTLKSMLRRRAAECRRVRQPVGQTSPSSLVGLPECTPRHDWRKAIIPPVWMGLSVPDRSCSATRE